MNELEDYVARGHYYRGKILNQFCFLEMNMSVIITESFTTERDLGNHMYHTLLERMTFENKRAGFQSIIYSQDDGNKRKYSAIFKELSALTELRNQFAHYPMLPIIPENFPDVAVTLAKFRDKPDVIRFTIAELDSIVDRIMRIDFEMNQAFKREKFYMDTETIAENNPSNNNTDQENE